MTTTDIARRTAAQLAAKAVRDLAAERERDAQGCQSCADDEQPTVDALRRIAVDIEASDDV